GHLAFLHAAEVYKWVVLGRVELGQSLEFGGRHGMDVRIIGEEAVAVVNVICAGGREAFLIALPTAAFGGELVGYGFTENIVRGGNGLNPIDTDQARSTGIDVGRGQDTRWSNQWLG